jgi:Uma2 family endonuclease
MPEPDAAAVRGTRRDYTDHHPSQRDVGLVVEVSDTSLAKDRRRTRVYGAGGIPVYWIINLVDRQVEVYTSPTSDGYGLMQIYKLGENVPVVLDGIVVGYVAVADLLP